MNPSLIISIEQALATVQKFHALGFWPAQSLTVQLQWCLRRARGETLEPPPYPLFMAGLIRQQHASPATYSLLEHQLRGIEIEMETLEMLSLRYAALCA